MKLSIIIPVLNEAIYLSNPSERLTALTNNGHEIIVVDGGSDDATVELSHRFAHRVLSAPRSRALQMNAGALQARGDVLVFLHADTVLPDNADHLINSALSNEKRLWGCFDVKLSGSHLFLRIVETSMNLRSRMTGVVTGDKTLFVRRDVFKVVGGFPDIPIMEDIAISKQLKALVRPIHIGTPVITSSRRWERKGILRTVTKMWGLRFAYFLGVSPNTLVKLYYGDHA